MPKPKLRALLIILIAGLASAQAYKWVDEQGGVHFGDRPPEVAKSEEIVLPEGQRSRSLEGRVVDDKYLTWDGTVRIRLPFLAQPGAKIEAGQVNKKRSSLFMFDDFGAIYIVLITVNDNPLLAFEDIVKEFQPRFELLDRQVLITERGKELRLVQYRKGGSHLTSDTYEGGKKIESAQLDLIEATAIFLAGANKDIIEVTAGETPLSVQTDRDPKEEINRLADLAEKRLDEFLSGVEID